MFETAEQKPINIKLVDFGLAASIQKKGDKLEKKHGTAYYIAPEILNKKPYDFKCDIWSCGVVLYCMLAGKPPYNGEKEEEICGKIKMEEDRVKKRYINAPVSTEALAFLRRLL